LNNFDLSYKPKFIFRSGHINTLYPYFCRPHLPIKFERERITLPDDDFLDLDWKKNNSQRLVVLCHGLEGSSESKYIKHLSQHFYELNIDVLAVNYRSCSGEMNLAPRAYHSGATDDLNYVLKKRTQSYDEVYLIGFSLGANLCLKYAGEEASKDLKNLKAVIGISAPCDLEGGSYVLKKLEKYLYTKNFLKSLKDKAIIKHAQFPDLFDLEYILSSKNVFEFDDRFTAPIHGFGNAINYYRTCSSLHYLKNIEIPCLIVSAYDDSFLSDSCYPYEIAKRNKMINLKVSKFGGHVGFVQLQSKYYWHEEQIMAFLGFS
jgi:predicted alpha/beta-fold hydrolase